MTLSPEQIKQLLAKPEKTKSSKGKTIDTSKRTHEVWFALSSKLFDEDTQELAKCANPNCIDPRGNTSAVVAKVNGQLMCRYCFLDGWLLTIEGQTSIDDGET